MFLYYEICCEIQTDLKLYKIWHKFLCKYLSLSFRKVIRLSVFTVFLKVTKILTDQEHL